MQHCPTTMRVILSVWTFLKSLTGFKLCVTTHNNICKRKQHVTSTMLEVPRQHCCVRLYRGLCISLQSNILFRKIAYNTQRILSPMTKDTVQGHPKSIFCSEDDLRSRIFGTFFIKFLGCMPLLGFSNI